VHSREVYFRLGFVLWIAVGCHCSAGLAVCGLDFLDRRRSCNSQNLVVMLVIPFGHGNPRSPLVHRFFHAEVGCTAPRTIADAALVHETHIPAETPAEWFRLGGFCFSAIHGLV